MRNAAVPNGTAAPCQMENPFSASQRLVILKLIVIGGWSQRTHAIGRVSRKPGALTGMDQRGYTGCCVLAVTYKIVTGRFGRRAGNYD